MYFENAVYDFYKGIKNAFEKIRLKKNAFIIWSVKDIPWILLFFRFDKFHQISDILCVYIPKAFSFVIFNVSVSGCDRLPNKKMLHLFWA